MYKAILALSVGMVLTACSSMPTTQKNSTSKAQSATQKSSSGTQKVASTDGSYTGEIVGNVASTKFSKLKIGMSKRQVEDLVGMPSDSRSYQTGKAWIPIAGAFSQDTYRTQTYYKNTGRLIYAKQGTRLYRIEVDRSEDGYQ
ncbi:hypothetical protein [Acinetobacter faecalis]|uniref:hypothetical protein n=1 Tax=Acinetobacter faecalis TaxID=2665161 RepID=UPI002A91FE90|nr:hypothetical protein [Acinetobacter faecalis]MDY6459087.1 hypothetical protein [Acinetobacter faecalis]